MAYNEKYFHTYCDANENTYRISLRELDYSGDAIEVEGGHMPWSVDQESSSRMKIGGVYPSRATAIFESEAGFTLEELYTGQENTYQLARLKNGVVDWIGFVIPDGFRERDYDQQKPVLEVYASDNLPALKGVPFVDQFGDNYGDNDSHTKSFLWVISEALKKTGSLLPIWTMVDIKTLSSVSQGEYDVTASGYAGGYFIFNLGNNPSDAGGFISKLLENGSFDITSDSATGTFSVASAMMLPWDTGQPVMVSVFVSETVPIFSSEAAKITIKEPESGLVLARMVSYNEYEPSEIGFHKEGADLGFIKVGDKVKIKYSSLGVDGEYTVTGFEHSIPPDPPYIRIQLDPQIPLGHVYENIAVEIISTQADFPDPLLTEHDVRVWILDSNVEGKTYYEARGGAMMTWDVLDAIGRQFNVKIQQNQGHWEIKRWNADKLNAGTYQWYQYNSEGTQIGRAPFGDDIVMPCLPTQQMYRIYGTNRNMDRVLKNVIVNYRYKYKQEGDSLQNLIVNGNFEGAFNPDPRGWKKVHVDNQSSIPPMSISKVTTGLPAGFTDAISLRNYADTRTLDNLTEQSNSGVNKGDALTISWWQRIDGQTKDLNAVYSIAIYESLEEAFASSMPPSGNPRPRRYALYHLVLDGVVQPRQGQRNTNKGRWIKYGEEGGYTHYRFQSVITDRVPVYGDWVKITVEAPEVPINGFLKFEIMGVAYPKLSGGDAVRKVPVFKPSTQNGGVYEAGFIAMVVQSENVSLETTGIFVGKLIDRNNEAIPQIDPFMYPDYQAQLTRNFSDTINEIEVLTGDEYGEYSEDRISGMWWNGERTKMWDTWDNRYGWSRQGLVTAKSVIEMYWKPTRLLEVDIQAPNIHWSTRFHFEEMPGLRFAILRGSINSYHDNFKGTITEVHDNAAPTLPPGGDDGGNTVEPNWQSTGVTRCVRDRDTGLNTGEVEIVQVDVNQASPTYGQERWVLSGEDTDMCPIGEPIDIYWGASMEPILPGALNYFPFSKNGDQYLVDFDNDGTGKHLVFIHRASLGTVTSIRYETGNYEAYGDLPSWEYLSDMTINGYVYKVMRQIYPSGTFTGLGLIFTIQ